MIRSRRVVVVVDEGRWIMWDEIIEITIAVWTIGIVIVIVVGRTVTVIVAGRTVTVIVIIMIVLISPTPTTKKEYREGEKGQNQVNMIKIFRNDRDRNQIILDL